MMTRHDDQIIKAVEFVKADIDELDGQYHAKVQSVFRLSQLWVKAVDCLPERLWKIQKFDF